MADIELDATAEAGISDFRNNDSVITELAERLAVKDESMGVKIKDAADNVGLVGLFIALFLGFLAGGGFNGIIGVLVGIAVAGAGILVTFLLVKALNSYGNMIVAHAEHIKILKQLEAKKALELFLSSPPVLPPEETPAAGEKLPEETSAEDNPGADPSIPDSLIDAEEQTGNDRDTTLTVDIENRTVVFEYRISGEIFCPMCGHKQSAALGVCLHCGCRFVYDGNGQSRCDEDLERLRRLLRQ